MLTEAPNGIDLSKAENLVEVDPKEGVVSNLVVGDKFTWFGVSDGTTPRAQSETNRPFAVRPHPSEGAYEHNGNGVLAGVPGVTATPTDTVPLQQAMITCIISFG